MRPAHTAMTIIRQDDLIESVAAALQYISYYHPSDYIAHLARAYEREQSPAAKDAIAQILTNSKMSAMGHRPICQDTGIVNVFIKIGMGVRLEGFKGTLEDAINEGVRQGYNHPDNKLRASVLADPLFERKNTKDNTPAVVHMSVVPGNTVDVQVAAGTTFDLWDLPQYRIRNLTGSGTVTGASYANATLPTLVVGENNATSTFAGTVTKLGEGVDRFAVGDEVFGHAVPRALRAMAGANPLVTFVTVTLRLAWPAIMAASILAKVARDRLMTGLHAQHPHYGFDVHKGYTTSAHRDALAQFGPSPVHRHRFITVRRAIREGAA